MLPSNAMKEIDNDIKKVVSNLKHYVDHGRVMTTAEGRYEPLIIEQVESKFKNLHKTDLKDFLAIDCSTYRLRGASNWGVYLHRVAWVSVKNNREIDSLHEDRMTTAIGDSFDRRRKNRVDRFNFESKMALKIIKGCSGHLLLDGGSYFGGGEEDFGKGRRYNKDLYYDCEKLNISLLTISKQSPTLHDIRGRDYLAKLAYNCPLQKCWVYHPVRKSNFHENLYGDIAAVKLCVDSPLVFRCDVMKYLAESKMIEDVLSPLVAVSNDCRCLGYPVPLYLAHKRTKIIEPKYFLYKYRVKDLSEKEGIEDILSLEEQISGFSDKLHNLNSFRGEF